MTLHEAIAAFVAAREEAIASGRFNDSTRRTVESILGWNADKIDQIEAAYVDKLQRATEHLDTA